MKRLIFILMAFTLTLSMSIAADVGTRSTQLQTFTVQQPTIQLDAVCILSEVTPAYSLSVQKVIFGTRDFQIANCSPDPVLYIDPGSNLINRELLSNNYNPIISNDQTMIFQSFRANRFKLNNDVGYRPIYAPPFINQLPTNNYRLPTIDTARHVSFS